MTGGEGGTNLPQPEKSYESTTWVVARFRILLPVVLPAAFEAMLHHEPRR